MPEDRSLPPVRLPAEAELAREALNAPQFARAARLARWVGDGIRVGYGGDLLASQLAEASDHLGLTGEDGLADTADAWQIALDTGLVDVAEDAGAEDEALPAQDEEVAVATATAGEALAHLTGGSPRDVLDLWLTAAETTLIEAAAPDLSQFADQIVAGDEIDLDAVDWDPDAEADQLDAVLGSLYLLTALSEDPGAEVPLPALAASVVVPDDMNEPTDAVLEEVSEVMMRLDDQFRLLEPVGLLAYRPVDEELLEELSEDGEESAAQAAEGPGEEDVARYGMVRLTPLGLFGVRTRLAEAGMRVPLVGDLAEADAADLLAGVAGHPEAAARTEAEMWLARRPAPEAARELLAAARGEDGDGPLRRLTCQQMLALVGMEAEPALREVLDDPHLGGLARVWLSERGVADVPPPGEEMVFWLTIDTLAAQTRVVDAESPDLRALVEGLVDQHSGFFDKAWRVGHPATADVLEAMGRLHPDRGVAKAARKAAFKARSAQGA
ncbi:hypothetical protein ACFV3R_13605 [Streptomyces sp. NPDC059740]|uniref:hypothetical protein n=1 Tax=Streptomyces sp. NPDC059740 TaxID=3346926 RepID=UPI00365448D0